MKPIRVALVTSVVTLLVACERAPSGPALTAEVTCHVGTPDSGTKCRAGTTSPGDPLGQKGSLRCGLNKKISVTRWSFIETRNGKDVYQFSRHFEGDPAAATNQTRRIEFSGSPVVVFEDREQVVVIQAPK